MEITTFPPVTGTGSGSLETFTNTSPVPTTIGGIPAGSTFNDVSMTDMWNALLYPYQNPAFTSFTSTMSTLLEVGTTIPAGSATFSWATSNSSNVALNSVTIDNVTAGTPVVANIANTGSYVATVDAMTRNTPSSQTWRITASNTKSATFTRTLTTLWQWKIYYGESGLTVLTEADVEALRVKPLTAGSSGSYAFLAGGYKWFCYPTTMGLKTRFRDAATNFDVAMDPVVTIPVTNGNGVVADYYCHRTYNTLGDGITITVS